MDDDRHAAMPQGQIWVDGHRRSGRVMARQALPLPGPPVDPAAPLHVPGAQVPNLLPDQVDSGHDEHRGPLALEAAAGVVAQDAGDEMVAAQARGLPADGGCLLPLDGAKEDAGGEADEAMPVRRDGIRGGLAGALSQHELDAAHGDGRRDYDDLGCL